MTAALASSTLPTALAPLIAQPRWVVWRWEITDKGKRTKVPYQAARPERKAKSNDPATWGSYADAIAAAEAGRADGIGFMLHDSEIAAFDIDDCRDPETGKVEGWAWTLIDECGSYAEVTVSGTGVRIIGLASGSYVHRNHKWPGSAGSVETYRKATRYIVVTGDFLKGSFETLANIDDTIDRTVAKLDTKGSKPIDLNGAARLDFNTAPRQRSAAASSYFSEATLPDQLDELIRNGAPGQDRSAAFHHAVCWLRDLGRDVSEIEDILARHPAGIAAKFNGRLGAEIERCYDKAKAPGERGESAPASSPKSRPQAIPLRWHGDGDPYADRAWLVRDLVPETGKGLLSGQWGAGKTFGVLDLSGSAMSGEPFAGKRVVRTGGVLFIAPEGASEIPIRLTGLVEGKLRGAAFAHAAAGERRIDPKRLPIAWIDECPRLVDRDAVAILTLTAEAAAERLRADFDVPLVLIVIDTVAAGARFDDENAAAENQKVMSALESLSHATGAFVMGVDHFGKMVETGTRGSSAKEAAADVVLAMLADKQTSGTISNTRMAIRKLRGGKVGLEIPYSLEVVEIGRNRDDEPITTCVVQWQLDRVAAEPASKERWPTSLKVFKSALDVALSDEGKRLRPFGGEGPEVLTVASMNARTEFGLRYPVEGETELKRADAKRKAFNRALKTALDRGLIHSRDIGGVDHLWFADAKDE